MSIVPGNETVVMGLRVLFWASLAAILYTYGGYPLWLFLRSVFRRQPVTRSDIAPSVSIIVPVNNEEQFVERKLQNLLSLDYPSERMQVVIVSDGSDERTNAIIRTFSGPNIKALFIPQRGGKAGALNQGIQEATGDIVVLTDVRQLLEPQALLYLIANFADPRVGAASGNLCLGAINGDPPISGEKVQRELENKLRWWEGEGGSVLGALGAFYAVRRELLVPLPADMILDDMFLPLNVVRQGFRVVYEKRACAWDDWQPSLRQEFRRKIRTLTGNYQLVAYQPWLLSWKNPLLFEFVSHKLMRLVVPFAMVTLLISSLLLDGQVYRLVLYAQAIGYLFAMLGFLAPRGGFIVRIAQVCLTFLMLNFAAMIAAFNHLTGKKDVWVR